MRVARTALLTAVLGSVLIFAAGLYGAGMPAGGSIHVFATPGATGTILITGAIGDFGKTLTINKSGKAQASGAYFKASLKMGTFEINAVAFNAKLARLSPPINKTTCSAEGAGTGSVTLLDGTGLYRGISGTINVTATFAAIAPRYTSGKKQGQCILNSQPVDQYAWITGSGTIKFS